MIQPLVSVTAPVTTPYRHGLFSAAVVVDPVDQREFHAGVRWEQTRTGVPAPYAGVAASDPQRATKVLPGGVEVRGASPVIRLYTGLSADLAGRGDHLEQARAALALVEQQSLEHYAWTGAAGNRPYLADPETPVLGGGPMPLASGIGLLEEHLSRHGGVLGVLWAPRTTAALLSQAQLIRPDAARLVAPLGNPVVFAHTSGAGPAGVAPEAGTVWMYATGAVMVRRSALVGPRLAEAHDPALGDVFGIVERFYTVGWNGPVAAVQVRLPA